MSFLISTKIAAPPYNFFLDTQLLQFIVQSANVKLLSRVTRLPFPINSTGATVSLSLYASRLLFIFVGVYECDQMQKNYFTECRQIITTEMIGIFKAEYRQKH